MQRSFFITGAVFGLLAVITGAFATHGLKPLLEASAMESFETGVQYQIYHALLLLILGNINTTALKFGKIIFYLLLVGVVLFSGSIYALATNDLSFIDFTGIALITPVGGAFLIAAWVFLITGFTKVKKEIK